MRVPDHIADAFHQQSRACTNLGSPFMGQLMRLCATMDWPQGPVTDRVFGWTGDVGPAAQSVPLRLAGALHALHLQGNTTLSPVYPPNSASDADLWRAVSRTLVQEAASIDAFIDHAPQTNEVRRSATLIAIGHWLTDRFGLPLRCSELGASAGLNLHWDRFALSVAGQTFGAKGSDVTLNPDWTGPRPPAATPHVAARGGVDLNPLSPQSDALRLQAYLWPDQPDRITRTRAAIALADTVVDQGDAIDWLAPRLTHQPGQIHMIFSTVAWQYFPDEKQTLGTQMIEAAGQTATDDAPLTWFGMETDRTPKGAALTLRLWPGDLHLSFGRADFHGRWIDWSPPATLL